MQRSGYTAGHCIIFINVVIKMQKTKRVWIKYGIPQDRIHVIF